MANPPGIDKRRPMHGVSGRTVTVTESCGSSLQSRQERTDPDTGALAVQAHPRTMICRGEHARILVLPGKIPDAIAELEELVRIEERALWQDHPERKRNLKFLAQLKAAGRSPVVSDRG